MTITINGSGTVTGITAGGLPDAIITQPELATGVAGTGPAFSASSSATQTFTSNTFTKIPLQVEQYDTANCFDSTTNYRFIPNVAGYYQFNGYLSFNSAQTSAQLAIYKNGSSFGHPVQITSTSGCWVNTLLYMNGSTDYVELYGFTGLTQGCSGTFNGFLARAA